MAITTEDQLFAALNSASVFPLMRSDTTTRSTSAGWWRSLAFVGAGRPTAITAPSSSGRSLSGSSGARTDPLVPPIPAGSNRLYLAGASVELANPGALLIYDRLADASITNNVSTNQTISQFESTRGVPDALQGGADEVAGELWIEPQVAGNATVSIQGIQYINQAGNSVNIQFNTDPLIVLPASIPAYAMVRIPLPTGDLVRSVSRFQWQSGQGMAASGSSHLMIIRPMAILSSNAATQFGPVELNLPIVANNPLIHVASMNAANEAGRIGGALRFVTG
jgi:hypothetical protein